MKAILEYAALIVALIGGILSILAVIWKVARLVTKEDLLQELGKLKDYVNEHFMRKK